MKKIFLIFISLFFSLTLLAQKPLVKFYMQDGSTKQYNLEDVDSIGIMDKKNNYVLRIHYRDKFVAYYPTEIIGSIKFEKDSLKRDVMNVYIFTFPKSYLLISIDSLIFYIDKYQPLTIGSQVWMLKNLNIDHYRNGDTIPEVRDPANWLYSVIGAWCFYNHSDSLGKIYGKLYNWHTVNDSRGLAPAGWHVPNKDEWKILIDYLGGYWVAGIKLKEIGTVHWLSPNEWSTNESGFTALPGGWREIDGIFYSIWFNSKWWSASDIDGSGAYSVDLNDNDKPISLIFEYNLTGLSVRCIKD